MGRRGVTELAVFLEASELTEQVQTQAPGETFRGQQRRAAGDHERKARHAFDAFVRGGNQVIDARAADVDRDRAEAAHGIDNVGTAMLADDPADLVNRVEDAGGGLAVDHRHVSDPFLRPQRSVQNLEVRRGIFGRSQTLVSQLEILRHLNDPLAIRPVGEHEQAAARRNRGGNHRFDTERAAALDQNRLIASRRREAGEGQQLVADSFDERVEFEVPRAGIVEHRLFDRQAGGQRPRGKQQFVTRGG